MRTARLGPRCAVGGRCSPLAKRGMQIFVTSTPNVVLVMIFGQSTLANGPARGSELFDVETHQMTYLGQRTGTSPIGCSDSAIKTRARYHSHTSQIIIRGRLYMRHI